MNELMMEELIVIVYLFLIMRTAQDFVSARKWTEPATYAPALLRRSYTVPYRQKK